MVILPRGETQGITGWKPVPQTFSRAGKSPHSFQVFPVYGTGPTVGEVAIRAFLKSHSLDISGLNVDLNRERADRDRSIGRVDRRLIGRNCVPLCSKNRGKNGGENMLRRTLQVVALCCGALGLSIPAQAQFRFSTEALFLDRDNSGSQALLTGPNAISSGGNSDIQTGYRFILGGSYDAYDLEFIGSQIDDWTFVSSGTLTDPLVFDDTAVNPVVVAAPPANTLAFTNSLFTAATTAGVEDLESERLQAGATFVVNGSSKFQDYQINIGTNPTRHHWRFGMGWRQMRLNENSGVRITGIFDALDTDDAAVAGDPTDDLNNALAHTSITGAGYTLRSGIGNGYDAFDVVGVAPDTLRLYYTSGAENILNGVQVSGGYQFFPESVVTLEVLGRAGLFHNYTQGRVGEYLIGSVNDNSSYQRLFYDSRSGVAVGGSLGAKAAVPVTDYISLTAGHEALYVANVALAPAQLGGLSNNPLGNRQYRVRNHDHLILHGLTLGMLVTW